MFTWAATPFLTMMANRCPRMPMPKPVAFNSRPSALTYSPLPSASMRILSPTLPALPQAFITKTSFTAVHAMVSTPFALILSANSTKPGKCFASQVGVNAPGTENSTTVFPLNSSSAVSFCGPSLVMRVNLPSGILSPTLMVIGILLSYLQVSACRRYTDFAGIQLPQLQDARADARLHRLQLPESLLRLGSVLELRLSEAEIDVRLVHVLHLTLR